MIRFCDKEIDFVYYGNMDREKMLAYFLNGHIEESVYVIEEDGKYKGEICYNSLINHANIYEAICEDSVILDITIWKNARNYFKKIRSQNQKYVLLPVLDKLGRLVCFAYEDEEANREIRMLRELQEVEGGGINGFSDVYPEINCVKIYGFNELGYFFAKYLEKSGIMVEVRGTMWGSFFDYTECHVPDFECLVIYAEGIDGRKHNWIENLVESVSAEFECIDKIYEKNIVCGLIKDASLDYKSLLEYLNDKKEIIICGIGLEEQCAYGFLKKNGIDVCCFLDMSFSGKSHKMFGKKILMPLEVGYRYKDAIFIDCVSTNSAWGMGEVDYFDYVGYKRNESIFFLKDYIKIGKSYIIDALSGIKVALLGDIYLCYRLYKYLEENGITVIGYLKNPVQDSGLELLPEIDAEDYINEEIMCLVATPEYFRPALVRYQDEKNKLIISYIREQGIDNYTDYFSYMSSFINIEACNNVKYKVKKWIPKRIILGSIEAANGCEFFRGLLDNHPHIMMLYYSSLNNDLFWLCVRLSTETVDNILPLFWEIYLTEDSQMDYYKNIIQNPYLFNKKMKELLSSDTRFTSQDLFIMIHIAYMYMLGRDITETSIKDMVVYWEPHHIMRPTVEACADWLGAEEISCDIINVVRNVCMSNGSMAKGPILMGWQGDRASVYDIALSYPSINKIKYNYSDRLVVRFEDLKCEPQKNISMICDKWGIPWSDTLMSTTYNGKNAFVFNGEKRISDFDLEPVYNTYEKIFSEFDRFRLSLINAPWQKEYGYPYVGLLEFSRRELQEMFAIGFRFDRLIDFSKDKKEIYFKIEMQAIIRKRLQRVRMLEYLMKEKSCDI